MQYDKKSDLELLDLKRKYSDVAILPLNISPSDVSTQSYDTLPFDSILSSIVVEKINNIENHDFPSIVICTYNEPTQLSFDNNGQIFYETLKEDSCFLINAGTYTITSKQPFLCITGIPNVQKIKILLESEISKAVRLYDQNKRYTVYNITKKASQSINNYNISDIIDLYRLLLGSPEVTAVEEYQSSDGLKSELRVVFWNQDSYHKFAIKNKEQYENIIQRINETCLNEEIKFERFTSDNQYVSEFPEKVYPNATRFIDWVFIRLFKQWFLDNIVPLGKVKEYTGNGVFNDTNITGSRFMKDRTNDVVRINPSKKSKENFPSLIAYSFDHALQYAINFHPFIYNRLTKLCSDVEKMAEEYLVDCEHSAVLVGHKSLGNEITLHTHRLGDVKKYSMTFIVRLTFDDTPVEYKFYEPIPDNDPLLGQYYFNPILLKQYVKDKKPNEIVSGARSSILVFNASHIPHSVSYSDDIYLYFVYDNVTFKEEMFEKIANSSQYSMYNDLYFYDL